MKLKVFLLISVFSFLVVPVTANLVMAEEVTEEEQQQEEDNQEEIEDLQEKIDKYKKKINELQDTASTLQNEISYIDSQISLTELQIQNSLYKISQTQRKIEELTQDIDELGIRIDKLEDSIDYQQRILSSRMRERYKIKEESPIFVIFGSSTLNRLIQKSEYLKVMEKHDNKLIDDMGRTKDAFDLQKRLFEEKKEEEEVLKTQLQVEKANLDSYRVTLADQQKSKQQLLEQTNNDESKYQELLEEARKELNQINNAVGVLKYVDGEEVEKGDLIGYQGNTGYSTGEHLHFGVYRYSSFEEIEGWNWYYNNHINPLDVLESRTVTWNTGCGYDSSGTKKSGDGDWEWPLENPIISQNYGSNTCYNWLYGGKVHPALDMYSSYGSPVYAVEDGTAYFCRNCLDDGGNGVFIFHDDNYMSVYWHLR